MSSDLYRDVFPYFLIAMVGFKGFRVQGRFQSYPSSNMSRESCGRLARFASSAARITNSAEAGAKHPGGSCIL